MFIGVSPAEPQLLVLLSNTGSSTFDENMNELRTDCIRFGNKILKNVLKLYADKVTTTPIHEYCKMLYAPILCTLATICMKEYSKLEARLGDKSIANFIVGCLGFLTNLCKNPPFYHIFNQNKNSLILDITMMLLKTTEREMELLTTDPVNFVSLGNNVCTRQNSKVPKTEAIRLLEALCTDIDGTLSFTVIICTEIIKYGCIRKNNESSPSTMSLSQMYNSSIFIIKTSTEILIETAILILADLNYTLHRRKDIGHLIESVMSEYTNILINSSSQLIKCRLALFFRFYGKLFYIRRADLFARMIKFLFNGVALEKEQMALALQCADALKSLCDYEEFRESLKPYIGELSLEICKLVTIVNAPAFYDLLRKIINCYTELIEDQVLNLIGVLVTRVNKEYEVIRNEGKNSNMTINQCWNIIRAICEQEKFYPKYLDQVETTILPLFEYMLRPKEIDFDDDIVQAITTLIEHRKGISENMAKIFPHLINFFNKYEKMFGSLLPTLNAYIYFGKNDFITAKENIEYIIKICFESLSSTKQKIELNNSEGAILLQVLLQTIEPKLMEPYIPHIIQKLLERLNTEPNTIYLSQQIYNAVLCSICNNAKVTLEKIEELKCTEPFFRKLLDSSTNYKITYEVKVLTIGLSTLLLQLQLPTHLDSYRTAILWTIVETLTNQTKRNADMLISMDKKVVPIMDDSKCEDDDDDDDYDRDYFEDEES